LKLGARKWIWSAHALRDVLIGRPVFWISDQTYLLVALGAALTAFFLLRIVKIPARLFLLPDALGLALFTVSGTQLALAADVPWLVACLMGVITGVAGGVLRDILCNEIPLIFLPGELYAIAASAGAITVVGADFAGLSPSLTALLGFVAAAGLRLIAMNYRLRAPTWNAKE
jgi:uncharacterized membrane protein YeiH